MGAGLPAIQATRCMAPASPVIAGKPAPTMDRGAHPISAKDIPHAYRCCIGRQRPAASRRAHDR
ncbi:hypothetical protein CXG50_27410 [Pseudomonas plecoglossicida]|nr:hypothetical protein CSW00_03480 [Pseudomonas sp. MR 02]PLU88089.1 hypothetical protein CXG44_05820 [Pseudomonas plecoglossicida]PLU93557.1 hypothetical protein CXG45_10930 [Pseudomonas plecoglossicida]PLV02046.1 hypothetical protein CXG50_27410 [Pseudomonas plecoglossicida]